jgi:hypothetical protein
VKGVPTIKLTGLPLRIHVQKVKPPGTSEMSVARQTTSTGEFDHGGIEKRLTPHPTTFGAPALAIQMRPAFKSRPASRRPVGGVDRFPPAS